MIVDHEERRTNPYSILELDEEEEPEDEEMEDKVDEMQVASPQRSPRRPVAKRTEREDASVGSMRHPLNRGKREEASVKKTIEQCDKGGPSRRKGGKLCRIRGTRRGRRRGTRRFQICE
jgi:hypothetical protein